MPAFHAIRWKAGSFCDTEYILMGFPDYCLSGWDSRSFLHDSSLPMLVT